MSSRLEFLKRKRISKERFSYYASHFNDFTTPQIIGLEESQHLLSGLNYLEFLEEFLKYDADFIDSDILRNIYFSLEEYSKSYVFTDDYEYCGLYLVNSKEGIEKSLNIAKEDENHTFFILASDRKYFIRINYYDNSHKDFPLSFDIKLSKNLVD